MLPSWLYPSWVTEWKHPRVEKCQTRDTQLDLRAANPRKISRDVAVRAKISTQVAVHLRSDGDLLNGRFTTFPLTNSNQHVALQIETPCG